MLCLILTYCLEQGCSTGWHLNLAPNCRARNGRRDLECELIEFHSVVVDVFLMMYVVKMFLL